MNARKTVFDLSDHPIIKTVERIKRARATMMRQHGPQAYVYFHREIEVDHEESQFCICDPVVIGQNDIRPSLYFANEILYPVDH